MPPELDNKLDDTIIDSTVPKETQGDLEKLNSTNAALRKEIIAAKKAESQARKALEALKDFDPEEYKRLKSLESAKQQTELEAKGEYEKALKTHQERADAAEQKALDAERKAHKAVLDSQLSQEFTRADGTASKLPHFLKLVDGIGVDEDGETVTFPTTLDDDGKEITTLGGYVQHLSRGELAFLFEPQNKAKGSSDRGGKIPAMKIQQVKASDAGRYLEEIASGTMVVVD